MGRSPGGSVQSPDMPRELRTRVLGEHAGRPSATLPRTPANALVVVALAAALCLGLLPPPLRVNLQPALILWQWVDAR